MLILDAPILDPRNDAHHRHLNRRSRFHCPMPTSIKFFFSGGRYAHEGRLYASKPQRKKNGKQTLSRKHISPSATDRRDDTATHTHSPRQTNDEHDKTCKPLLWNDERAPFTPATTNFKETNTQPKQQINLSQNEHLRNRIPLETLLQSSGSGWTPLEILLGPNRAPTWFVLKPPGLFYYNRTGIRL